MFTAVVYIHVCACLQEAALARLKAQQAAFMQFADDSSMDTDSEAEQQQPAAAAAAATTTTSTRDGQEQQVQQQQTQRSASQELAAIAAAAAGLVPAEALQQQQQQQQQDVCVHAVRCSLGEVSGECVVCRAADNSKGPLALLAFAQVCMWRAGAGGGDVLKNGAVNV